MGQFTFQNFREQFKKNGEKVIVQNVIGRSGSLFMQSLLDGHPQVLMFPGVINFFSEIIPELNENQQNWAKVVKENIDLWIEILSPYNIHNDLGEENNKTLTIESTEIIKIMSNECGIKETVSNKTIFLGLHYAIGIYFKVNMDQVKCIYIHEHNLNFNEQIILSIIKQFTNVKILSIIRDPRSNHQSINNWVKKKRNLQAEKWQENKYSTAEYSNLCYWWYKNSLRSIAKNQNNHLIIRLEDIHTYKNKFLKILCEGLGIDYSDTILKSTFGGHIWQGDNFSTKKDSFREENKFNKWKPGLSIFWQLFYEIILRDELKMLGYDFFYSKYHIFKLFVITGFPCWYMKDIDYLLDKDFYNYRENKQHSPLYVFLREFYLYTISRFKLFGSWVNKDNLNIKGTLLTME